MKFECALKAIRKGKTVKRKAWNKNEIDKKKYLCLEKYHCEILWTEDLLANDWVIVDECFLNWLRDWYLERNKEFY